MSSEKVFGSHRSLTLANRRDVFGRFRKRKSKNLNVNISTTPYLTKASKTFFERARGSEIETINYFNYLRFVIFRRQYNFNSVGYYMYTAHMVKQYDVYMRGTVETKEVTLEFRCMKTCLSAQLLPKVPG